MGPARRNRPWIHIAYPHRSGPVRVGRPDRTAYGAAKAALEFLLPGLGWRAGQPGITVNSVAPGPTETKLFRDTNPEGSAGAARHLAGIPVGRFGQPHELAAAICFLLSEDAGFITGQTLRVDGGGSIGAA